MMMTVTIMAMMMFRVVPFISTSQMVMFPSWQWWCFHRDNDDVSIVTMMMFPGQLCCFQDVTRSWAEIGAAHWLLREGSNCHPLGQNFSRNLNIVILKFWNFKSILITRSCAALRAADLGLSGQDAFRARTFWRFPVSLFCLRHSARIGYLF